MDSNDSSSKGGGLTKTEAVSFEKLKLKWKELNEEDIILDGLYLNCTRLVQEYFEKFLKLELKTNRVVEIGLKSALQLLADKDLRWAEKLFNNMGFDANTKISQICFFTTYKELRDYLSAILIERKIVNDSEIEMIEYLKKLEGVYVCRSYAQAKQKLKLYRNWSNYVVNPNKGKNENFECNDLVKFTQRNALPAQLPFMHYGYYVLEWLREWSKETRERIVIEGSIGNEENSENLKSVNPVVLWTYLVEHHCFKMINDWIAYSFASNADEMGLFKVKISQDMIDSAFKYYEKHMMQHYFANQLAPHQMIASNESKQFTVLVNRLSSSQTFLQYAKTSDFHSNFVQHALKHYPIQFLWSYLDQYDNEIKLDNFNDLNYKESCFKMMNAFRNISNDESNFSTICLKNIEFNLNKINLSIEKLFESNELSLIGLGLSLYCDVPLSTASSSKISNLVEIYPALRSIIDNKVNVEPTSLYALLQEHTQIDASKFFKWQLANKMRNEKGGEQNQSSSSSSLLSFNNHEFAKQYSYKDQLDYGFFLKQGRPFFAYYNFIIYQTTKFGKIHKTVMDEARIRAHIMAIQNYDNNRIASSCIIFSELINGNTLKIKLHIHMMKNILFDYYRKRGLDEQSSSEKCKNTFIDFLKNEIDAKKMVSIFENALITLMTEKFDSKQMFTMDASSLWLPLMCFCKLYDLAYSTKYLDLCAESNQWLMYLIFSQLYQIPRSQVISNLEYFTDTGLKQHLEYALHNVITSSNETTTTNHLAVKSPITKVGKKKSRKTSRRKSERKLIPDSSDSEEVSDVDIDSYKSVNNDLKDANNLDSIDFYELLINCQNSPDPVKQLQIEALRWHTPVLAVFATFYPQHDKISCLCTFLFASLKQEFNNFNNDVNKKSVLFDLNDLKVVIQSIAMRGFLRTLLNSLKIFIPNTILEIYADFLYHVFVTKDVTLAEKLHSSFKYELIKVTLSKHQSYIPLEWYDDVISKLTRITILKCRTINDLNNLTNILKQKNEYQKLIKLVYTLKSNKLSINSDDWLSLDDHSDQFTDTCLKVIEELLKLQKFDEAEQLANYCELSKDRIHLARIARQIDLLRINNDFEEILEFWKTSHVQLLKIGIKDSDFIDFLKFQNSRSNLTIEKIVLLNLICQLCPNDHETSKNFWLLLLQFVLDYKKRNEVNNLREIFKKMLLFGKLNSDPIKELINSIVEDGQIIDFNTTSNTLNDQNIDALNILLNNLIDIGKLSQAYVIAKYFKYYNQDLRTILNMLYVCLNMMKPDEVDYSIQTLDSTSYKGIRLTNVLRSISRTGDSTEILKDRIDCLEKLSYLSHHGTKYCQQIKLDYRLANELLQIDYRKIIQNENKYDLLKVILCASNKNKYELAKDFVSIYEFNQEELCLLLIDEILPNMRTYIAMNKDSNPNINKLTMIFNPANNEEFSKLIKIFSNPALFGTKLLEKTKNLLHEAKNNEDFMLLTELLIRSHDCFIQSCSMEGISNVLQVCKQCAAKLEKAGEFNIMIRLLTGIGHFSEMTYILDFLWNNHQFEMLFGKGIGKDDKLRLALLDYLKRYHPSDHETYTMVTLNFTMHREIAKMLEEAAYQQLKLLENKSIDNTADTITDLQSILQYFSDAAQSFMKEDCVRQAESCIRKARLIALQINFLSNNRVIVNLNNAALTKFISTHPKFWEAFIVSEAYDKKSDGSLWSLAIYNIFIISNNEKYLIDFKGHIPLTTNIIEEVASRFKGNNENSKLSNQSTLNMKKLLKYCKDISVYYKIALQLDFKDVINELSTRNYSSILNDLVTNKRISSN